MHEVQWDETQEMREDGNVRRWRRPGARLGLSAYTPAGSSGTAPLAGEEVWSMNPAGARDSAPDGGRLARLWPLLGAIFLPNLAPPITELLHAHPTPWRLGAILAGVTLFIGLYLWTNWRNDLSRAVYPAPSAQPPGRWRWVPVALLVGVSVALVLADGPRWLVLLIFTAAAAGGRFPLGQAVRIIAALAILGSVLGWMAHDAWSDVGSAAFWTVMSGILTVIINHFRRTNRALRVAREEIARLAVEAERLRFARDLHDLLGHDLARIALQSEVVEALVPTAPERAIATAREMGETAREALHEVRAAVAGYRQPTLASEMRGAHEILAAAGIAYRNEGRHISVPPAMEAVLAWTVREGVTNVVKHSRARHCTIRTIQEPGQVGVEVIDDGPDTAPDAGRQPTTMGGDGHGLMGLSERVAALNGRCVAGPHAGGGFRLLVVLPVQTESSLPAAAGDRTVAPAPSGGRS